MSKKTARRRLRDESPCYWETVPVPAAEKVDRTYTTRFRERIALHKRYDAIFACVVKKVLSDDSLLSAASRPSINGDELRRRSASETSSEKSRSSFDSEPEVLPSLSDSQEQPPKQKTVFKKKPSSKTKAKRLTLKKKVRKATQVIIAPSPVINGEISCRCGVVVCSHARLHEHVLYEHSYPTRVLCSQCGASDESIFQQHVCNLCNVFADNLEDHLKNHYQDRLGSGALMECRMCCKTFLTLHEVMLHERVSHAKLRKELKYQCECCEEKFPTKQSCDTHLLSHFEDSIGEVWDRVEEMQNKLTGLVVVDQCPICLSVMGTRKSFRLHIIQKHLLKDPQDFLEVLSLSPLVFQKFAIQQDTPWFTFASEAVSNGAVVKKEIKQECVEC